MKPMLHTKAMKMYQTRHPAATVSTIGETWCSVGDTSVPPAALPTRMRCCGGLQEVGNRYLVSRSVPVGSRLTMFWSMRLRFPRLGARRQAGPGDCELQRRVAVEQMRGLTWTTVGTYAHEALWTSNQAWYAATHLMTVPPASHRRPRSPPCPYPLRASPSTALRLRLRRRRRDRATHSPSHCTGSSPVDINHGEAAMRALPR